MRGRPGSFPAVCVAPREDDLRLRRAGLEPTAPALCSRPHVAGSPGAPPPLDWQTVGRARLAEAKAGAQGMGPRSQEARGARGPGAPSSPKAFVVPRARGGARRRRGPRGRAFGAKPRPGLPAGRRLTSKPLPPVPGGERTRGGDGLVFRAGDRAPPCLPGRAGPGPSPKCTPGAPGFQRRPRRLEGQVPLPGTVTRLVHEASEPEFSVRVLITHSAHSKLPSPAPVLLGH